jgi:hypothetical protein
MTEKIAPRKIHSYQASANAFGGHLIRPVGGNLPTLAPSSLPTVGGYYSARHNDFQFHELVSIDEAYTHVGGSFNRETGSYTTIASSVIKGLNVGHTLFAERIVGQISLEHPADGGPPRVSFLGSHFKDLRIGRCELHPEFQFGLCDDVGGGGFLENGRLKSTKFLSKAESQSKTFMQDWLGDVPADPNGGPHAQPVPQEGDNTPEIIGKRGSVVCSIVERIKEAGGNCGEKNYGHAIKVPHFGLIFLGELTVLPGSFALTMIRLDLGSPIGGSLSGATANVAGGTKGGPTGSRTGP